MTPTFSVHRTLLGVLIGVLLFSLVSLPKAQASTMTQTRFFSGRKLNAYKYGISDAFAWKSMYQAKVGTSGSYTYKTYEDFDGLLTLYTGIRVWKRTANGTETQLTSSISAIVSLYGPETDYASPYQLQGYWTPSNTTMLKTDVLAIYAYSSTDNATWALMTEGFYSQWNTESLLATKLISSTWNITYEIAYQWDGFAETWHVFAAWANTYSDDRQPRISNIQLDNGETTPTPTSTISPYAMLILGLGFGFLLTAVVFRTSKPTTQATR